jgi:diaminopimelate epimerase
MRLAKAHAYGNDFLFVSADEVERLALDELSRRLCNRHAGIGADGVIAYTVAPDGTARMRLVNADGSPSELSGNGLRCLAALLLHHRAQSRATAPGVANGPDVVRVHTDAGWKALTLVGRSGSRFTFRAAMGAPEHITRELLDVAGERLNVTTLTMGNPQCVTLVDELPDDDRFARLGPALATHARFAAGTNVEFARVEAPDRVRIRIWERGVGPTQASGTGACASAVAAALHGGTNRDVDVIAPGGTQRVEWRDDGVYLTGWAEVLFEGEWVA